MFWLFVLKLVFYVVNVRLLVSTDVFGSWELQWGKGMTGHEVLFLTSQSLQDCFKECHNRSKCLSFNYYWKGQWCTLNSKSQRQEPASMEGKEEDFVFCDIGVLKKDTGNPCKSHETYDQNDIHQPCSVTECDDPEPIGVSRILGNKKSIGSRVKFMCYYRGNLIQSYISICLSNGSWSRDDTFSCDPEGCSAVAPTNGVVSAEEINHDKNVTYSCNYGYVLIGPKIRKCANGDLSGKQPYCIKGVHPSTVSPYAVLQSSTYNENGVAEHAIDGNTDGAYLGNSCTHTHYETLPWWMAKYLLSIVVTKVTLVNREDCCSYRLRNVQITVDEQECGFYAGPADSIMTVTVSCSTVLVGKNIKIQILGKGVLTLCEVYIE